MRNLYSLNRDATWTAWDANVKPIYRRPAKVRKILRRNIKRRQRQLCRKEIELAISDHKGSRQNATPCTFVSVWDGGVEVESPALFDEDLGIVYDIQQANLPAGVLNSLKVLDREYIRVSSK